MPLSTRSKRPNVVRRLYDWMLSLAQRKHAGSWLAGLSFAEASFFPIPPDVMLIPMCLGSTRRALRFATLCTVASVVGGTFGYFIGAQLWDSLIYALVGVTLLLVAGLAGSLPAWRATRVDPREALQAD